MTLQYQDLADRTQLTEHALLAIDPAGDGGGLAFGMVDQLGRPRLLWATRAAGYSNPRAVAAGIHSAPALQAVARTGLVVVAERPKKRRDQRSKHRAVDLLIDVLTSIKRKLKPRVWVNVSPERWKASVPKEIHHRRAWAVLTPEEVATSSLQALDPDGPTYQHDTADAIALWLWAVGRLGRGGGTLG